MKRVKFICCLLILTFICTIPISAKNNQSIKVFSEEELRERYEQIQAIMLELHLGEIAEEKALSKLEDIHVVPIKGESVLLEDGEEYSIKSNPDHAISLPRVNAMYDQLSGYHYVAAHFFWTNTAHWQSDFPNPWPAQPGVGVDIGGPDGFGISFSRPINYQYSNFITYNQSGYPTTWYYPTRIDANAVIYIKQDYGSKMADGSYSYNWDSGYMDVFFLPQNPGQTMSIWQQMAHTWGTTNVYITGISHLGISWGFDKQTHKWEAHAKQALSYTPQ